MTHLFGKLKEKLLKSKAGSPESIVSAIAVLCRQWAYPGHGIDIIQAPLNLVGDCYGYRRWEQW